jgi:hypothetical protein
VRPIPRDYLDGGPREGRALGRDRTREKGRAYKSLSRTSPSFSKIICGFDMRVGYNGDVGFQGQSVGARAGFDAVF